MFVELRIEFPREKFPKKINLNKFLSQKIYLIYFVRIKFVKKNLEELVINKRKTKNIRLN